MQDVDASEFAKNTNVANLKSDAEEVGIDKLELIPNSLSTLKSKVDRLDVDKLVPVPIN